MPTIEGSVRSAQVGERACVPSAQADETSSVSSNTISLFENFLLPGATAAVSASFGLTFAIFAAIMVCVGACYRCCMAKINADKEARIQEAVADKEARIYEADAQKAIHEADAKKAEAEAQKAQAEA